MPQRFLRPGITNSELWNAVSWEAQSLFIRILTLVDDFGQYDARPAIIWGHCYQIWNELHPDAAINLQQVAQMLQQLAASNLIEVRRTKSGKQYLQVTQWKERVRDGCKPRWSDGEAGEVQLQQLAATCSNLLPPSSPSTSSSSSPPPSTAGRAEASINPDVEFPAGFPRTETDAQACIGPIGCSAEFAVDTWRKACGRGGRDAKDVPIRQWSGYLATEWKWERQRLFKEGKARPEIKTEHPNTAAVRERMRKAAV